MSTDGQETNAPINRPESDFRLQCLGDMLGPSQLRPGIEVLKVIRPYPDCRSLSGYCCAWQVNGDGRALLPGMLGCQAIQFSGYRYAIAAGDPHCPAAERLSGMKHRNVPNLRAIHM